MGEKVAVYIAAPFELQALAKDMRTLLERTGRYTVTSRWIDEPVVAAEAMTDEHAYAMAVRDLEDIDGSVALVALNPESFRRTGTGGRHVEFGYVLGFNACMRAFYQDPAAIMPIFVLGVRSNVFHRLPDALLVATNPLELLGAMDHYFDFSTPTSPTS